MAEPTTDDPQPAYCRREYLKNNHCKVYYYSIELPSIIYQQEKGCMVVL